MADALEPLKLDEDYINEFFNRQNITQFKLADMREDFVKFCKFMIGFPVRDYQAFVTDVFNREQKTAIVASTGVETGKTIRKRTVHWFAPSSMAASSISCGSPLKKFSITST